MSARHRSTDVAIIGAGPAGLTAADLLIRAGLSCVAIEALGNPGLVRSTLRMASFGWARLFPRRISTRR